MTCVVIARVRQVGGQPAARRPEIDLEGERVAPRLGGENPRQRRVGDDTAIPIILAVNLDRGKTGRQRARSHEMLGAQPALGAVEVDEIAGAHIDGGDAHPGFTGIQPIEIDQALQGRLERCRVIEAGGRIAGER
jgi:hypothetical protein